MEKLDFEEHNMDDAVKARMVARAGGLVFVLVQFWNERGHRKVLLTVTREDEPAFSENYILDSFAAGIQQAKRLYLGSLSRR